MVCQHKHAAKAQPCCPGCLQRLRVRSSTRQSPLSTIFCSLGPKKANLSLLVPFWFWALWPFGLFPSGQPWAQNGHFPSLFGSLGPLAQKGHFWSLFVLWGPLARQGPKKALWGPLARGPLARQGPKKAYLSLFSFLWGPLARQRPKKGQFESIFCFLGPSGQAGAQNGQFESIFCSWV